MRKVRIKKLPVAREGAQVPYGNETFSANTLNDYSDPKTEVNRTLQPVKKGEAANIEAEKGEVAVTNYNGSDTGQGLTSTPSFGDGIPETYIIGGKRHAQGGTALDIPEGSFIFSDYKKGKSGERGMKISNEGALEMFGMKGPSTPADIAKKYNLNDYKKRLLSGDTDQYDKTTSELMINNYMHKLGGLALIQEAHKGFPNGVPDISMPYLQANNIDPQMFMPQEQQSNEDPSLMEAQLGGPFNIPGMNKTGNEWMGQGHHFSRPAGSTKNSFVPYQGRVDSKGNSRDLLSQDIIDRFQANYKTPAPYETPEYDTILEMPNLGIADMFKNFRDNRSNRISEKNYAPPMFRAAYGGDIPKAQLGNLPVPQPNRGQSSNLQWLANNLHPVNAASYAALPFLMAGAVDSLIKKKQEFDENPEGIIKQNQRKVAGSFYEGGDIPMAQRGYFSPEQREIRRNTRDDKRFNRFLVNEYKDAYTDKLSQDYYSPEGGLESKLNELGFDEFNDKQGNPLTFTGEEGTTPIASIYDTEQGRLTPRDFRKIKRDYRSKIKEGLNDPNHSPLYDRSFEDGRRGTPGYDDLGQGRRMYNYDEYFNDTNTNKNVFTFDENMSLEDVRNQYDDRNKRRSLSGFMDSLKRNKTQDNTQDEANNPFSDENFYSNEMLYGNVDDDKARITGSGNQRVVETEDQKEEDKYSAEFNEAINSFIDVEEEGSSSGPEGYVGGGSNFGTNDPSMDTREKAIKHYYDKYWSEVKDLPPGVRTRALQLAINTGDPYGELLVAEGDMSVSDRIKLKDEAKKKGLTGYDKFKYITDSRKKMLSEKDEQGFSKLDKLLVKIQNNPAEFSKRLNTEQNRYYNQGLNSGKNSQKMKDFHNNYYGTAGKIADKYYNTSELAPDQSAYEDVNSFEPMEYRYGGSYKKYQGGDEVDDDMVKVFGLHSGVEWDPVTKSRVAINTKDKSFNSKMSRSKANEFKALIEDLKIKKDFIEKNYWDKTGKTKGTGEAQHVPESLIKSTPEGLAYYEALNKLVAFTDQEGIKIPDLRGTVEAKKIEEINNDSTLSAAEKIEKIKEVGTIGTNNLYGFSHHNFIPGIEIHDIVTDEVIEEPEEKEKTPMEITKPGYVQPNYGYVNPNNFLRGLRIPPKEKRDFVMTPGADSDVALLEKDYLANKVLADTNAQREMQRSYAGNKQMIAPDFENQMKTSNAIDQANVNILNQDANRRFQAQSQLNALNTRELSDYFADLNKEDLNYRKRWLMRNDIGRMLNKSDAENAINLGLLDTDQYGIRNFAPNFVGPGKDPDGRTSNNLTWEEIRNLPGDTDEYTRYKDFYARNQNRASAYMPNNAYFDRASAYMRGMRNPNIDPRYYSY